MSLKFKIDRKSLALLVTAVALYRYPMPTELSSILTTLVGIVADR